MFRSGERNLQALHTFNARFEKLVSGGMISSSRMKGQHFMGIILSRSFAVSILIAAFVFGGCSTTKMIVSEWNNPAYTSVSFGRIMVGGASEQASIRRNFEDAFVAQLRTTGVDGLPSYRYIPEDEKLDEARLKQAAQTAGADAAILARPIKVEQKTEYGPSYYPVPSFGFFGSHFGATWYGPFGAPNVYRYNVYTSEVTLYDVRKDAIVWTGTIKTNEPESVNKGIKSYVEAVVKALNEKNLLGIRH
jgi:hypothetical protein